MMHAHHELLRGIPIRHGIRQLRAIGRRELDTELGREHAHRTDWCRESTMNFVY